MKTIEQQIKASFFLWCLLFALQPLTSQTLIQGLVRDVQTKETLPFANIYISDTKGTIANEEGRFSLELPEAAKNLKISFVGYETQNIPIQVGKKNYLVEMKKVSFPLTQIEIRAGDERAYGMLFKAIKASRKHTWKERTVRTFRRTIASREKNQPAEFMEAFYNVELLEGGINSMELKNGRVGIPLDSYVLNFDIGLVLQHYQLFGDRKDYLPASALQAKSMKQLKRDYYVRIADKSLVAQDTIWELRFEAKQPGLYFDGTVFVNHSNNIIEKISLEAEKLVKIPFETVIDSDLNKVVEMGAKLEVGFKYQDDRPVMEYQQLLMDFWIESPQGLYDLHSNSKFFFYGYGKPFELPFFKISANYNDYEKIMGMPYNRDFWKRTPLIAETGREKAFRKDLEQQRLFINSGGADWEIPILKKRFMTWSPDVKIDSNLIAPVQAVHGMGEDAVIYVESISVPNDNLFAETFIFLDYNCFADTVIYKTEAVLDYRYSYTYWRDVFDFEYLDNFLHLTKANANELYFELANDFSKECPKRDDLMWELREAERKLEQDIGSYFVKVQGERNVEHLEKVSEKVKERLEGSFVN